MKSFFSWLDRNSIAIITILFWIINVSIFFRYGVKHVADSARYLEYANSLASGFHIDIHNIWYIGYVLFIYVAGLISKSTYFLILLQYALSYFALLSLYKSSLLLFENKIAAIVSTLGFIFFFEISCWNSYILPESLYVSFICFTVLSLTCALKHTSTRSVSILIFITLLTSVIKPTGIALFISVGLAIALLVFKNLKRKTILIASLIAMPFLFALANRMLMTYPVLENYKSGEIIYEISFTKFPSSWVVLNSPSDLYIPPTELPKAAQVFSFFMNNPVYSAKLFFAKISYLFLHVKPYWSWHHNLFCLIFLLSFYVGAVQALMKKSEIDKKIVTFTIVFVLIHALIVGLTWEDWDGRFLIPMLPLIFLLGGKSAATYLSKKTIIKS